MGAHDRPDDDKKNKLRPGIARIHINSAETAAKKKFLSSLAQLHYDDFYSFFRFHTKVNLNEIKNTFSIHKQTHKHTLTDFADGASCDFKTNNFCERGLKVE